MERRRGVPAAVVVTLKKITAREEMRAGRPLIVHVSYCFYVMGYALTRAHLREERLRREDLREDFLGAAACLRPFLAPPAGIVYFCRLTKNGGYLWPERNVHKNKYWV
jgi:hypothetical protein